MGYRSIIQERFVYYFSAAIDFAIPVIFIPFMVFAIIMLYLYRRAENLRRQAKVARDEFLATVSHELRTPLTAIHGSLALIANGVGGKLPAKASELTLKGCRTRLRRSAKNDGIRPYPTRRPAKPYALENVRSPTTILSDFR